MQKQPRGYLLIEAMVAGALLATLLGAAFAYIADGRAQVNEAANRAIAVSLAQDKVDELMADGSRATVEEASETPVPGYPQFKRTWEVTSASIWDQSAPPLPNSNALHEIRVTVSYPVRDGTDSVTLRTFRR